MDIGEKLRLLRIRRGLTQEDMADRLRTEQGLHFAGRAQPCLPVYRDADRHAGMPRLQPESVFQRGQGRKDRLYTTGYVRQGGRAALRRITWLVPDAQKNTMEPILVDLGEDGRTYELLPHQGEEFGYVLSGSIFLVDGETKTRIPGRKQLLPASA